MFPGYNIVKHAFPGISDAKLAKNRLYVKEKTDLIENHIGEDARYKRFPREAVYNAMDTAKKRLQNHDACGGGIRKVWRRFPPQSACRDGVQYLPFKPSSSAQQQCNQS